MTQVRSQSTYSETSSQTTSHILNSFSTLLTRVLKANVKPSIAVISIKSHLTHWQLNMIIIWGKDSNLPDSKVFLNERSKTWWLQQPSRTSHSLITWESDVFLPQTVVLPNDLDDCDVGQCSSLGNTDKFSLVSSMEDQRYWSENPFGAASSGLVFRSFVPLLIVN